MQIQPDHHVRNHCASLNLIIVPDVWRGWWLEVGLRKERGNGVRNEATTSYVYRRLRFRLQREVSRRLNLRRCGWEGGSRGYGDGVWSSTMRSSLCDTAFATNLRYLSLPETRRSRGPLSTVPAPVGLTPSQTLFMRTAEDFSSTSETGPRMSASSHQPTSLGLEAYSLQILRRLDVRHRARWEGLW